MPGRIAEAIIEKRLIEDKPLFSPGREAFWRRHAGRLGLPFLALEADGGSMTPAMEARLEHFVTAARRLREELSTLRGEPPTGG